jgi:hypothetical protein
MSTQNVWVQYRITIRILTTFSFIARPARTLYIKIAKENTSASYYKTSREKMIYVIAKKITS